MSEAVRIFRPAKTAMQSGRGKTEQWLLEFAPSSAQRPDPLMGWASSRNTQTQVRLKFDTREEAVAYAERKGLQAVVEEPHERRFKPKSYADNFRPERLRGS